MSIEPHKVEAFLARAREVLSPLAREFNLELRQVDDLTFALVSPTVEIQLYLYPSHRPMANIALFPLGEEWEKWRRQSLWGSVGIWISYLIAYRRPEVAIPDTHFREEQDMCKHVDALTDILRDLGSDLLAGDPSLLFELAAFMERRLAENQEK